MVFEAHYHEDVILAGGLRVCFRGIVSPDEQKRAAGFARLPPELRDWRFFSTKAALTPAELQFFAGRDGVNHFAIAAVEIYTNGEEGVLVAIGHFSRASENSEVTEIALAVVDARQGMSVGRILLERLIAAAAEREVGRIRLLAENERMRRLIRRTLGDTRSPAKAR
jgi:GNAT superfamily N-acetyltransferase